MQSPEISRSCRRSWREIHDYYASGLDKGISSHHHLLSFSALALANPHYAGLATVGRLACILVYRDEDCTSEKGWFLIGGAQERINIGFFNVDDYDPKALLWFSDAESAIAYFDETLVANGFIQN